ncbi:MAG: DHHA1 domain-containing protein [Candidatus Hydrothermarchaeota archaeon]
MIIISHTDADGICAASLVVSANPYSDIVLTQPRHLDEELENVLIKGYGRLVICDLAIDYLIRNEVLNLLRQISREAEVIYIDHHQLIGISKDDIAGNVLHEIDACTTEIAFKAFPNQKLERLVVYGAVGDYMDDTKLVSEIVSRYDKRLIYMDACLLTQALAYDAKDKKFRLELILRLSQGEHPRDIEGVVDRAIKASKFEESVYEMVREKLEEFNSSVFVEIPYEGYLGKAATFASGLTGKIAFAMRKEKNTFRVSARRPLNSDLNLGLLIQQVAKKVKGSGGGHAEAAGATIPTDKKDDFIREILSKTKKL